MKLRADSLIYFALTLAANKDSYAKMQIMAASHKDAVPCVLKNEGKKLYQMFQGMFTMTNLHQASLPSVRADFYAIAQNVKTVPIELTVQLLHVIGTGLDQRPVVADPINAKPVVEEQKNR